MEGSCPDINKFLIFFLKFKKRTLSHCYSFHNIFFYTQLAFAFHRLSAFLKKVKRRVNLNIYFNLCINFLLKKFKRMKSKSYLSIEKYIMKNEKIAKGLPNKVSVSSYNSKNGVKFPLDIWREKILGKI